MVLKACNFRQLWHNNRVARQWVPNREGIEGSEKVDKLDEEAAKTRFIRPISWCNLQNNDLKQVPKWEMGRQQNHLRQAGLADLARIKVGEDTFIKLAKMVVPLNKGDLELLAKFLIGHAGLRYHLYKLVNPKDQIFRQEYLFWMRCC